MSNVGGAVKDSSGGDGLDEIRNAAEISVSRACGFAALGISVVVLALSYDLPMALQAGAVLTMMLLAVLIYRGHSAVNHDYKRTEVYLLLDRRLDLPASVAQQLVGRTLRTTYYRYARVAGGTALVMWAGSLAARLVMPQA